MRKLCQGSKDPSYNPESIEKGATIPFAVRSTCERAFIHHCQHQDLISLTSCLLHNVRIDSGDSVEKVSWRAVESKKSEGIR